MTDYQIHLEEEFRMTDKPADPAEQDATRTPDGEPDGVLLDPEHLTAEQDWEDESSEEVLGESVPEGLQRWQPGPAETR